MKYILTQEEMDNLVPIAKYGKLISVLNLAKQLVLKGHEFSCIYISGNYDGYCDKCPLAGLDNNYEYYNLICTKEKNFSQ